MIDDDVFRGDHIFFCGAIPTIQTYGYKTYQDAKNALGEMKRFHHYHQSTPGSSILHLRYNPFYFILQYLPANNESDDPSYSCNVTDINQMIITSAAEVVMSPYFDEMLGKYISRHDSNTNVTKFKLINLLHEKYGYIITRPRLEGSLREAIDFRTQIIQMYADIKNFCGIPIYDLSAEKELYEKHYMSNLEEYKHAMLMSSSKVWVKRCGHKTMADAKDAAEECNKVGAKFGIDYKMSSIVTYFTFDVTRKGGWPHEKFSVKKASTFANEVYIKTLKRAVFHYVPAKELVAYEDEYTKIVKEKLFAKFGYVVVSSIQQANRPLKEVIALFAKDVFFEEAGKKMGDFLKKWK